MWSSRAGATVVDREESRQDAKTQGEGDGREKSARLVVLIGSLLAVVASASPAFAQAPAVAPAPAPAPGPASAPAPASASAPSPASEASRVEASTGRPIVWIGASIFSLSYIAAALAATTSYPSDTDVTTPHGALWIPVVGPFIVMGKASGAGDEILFALDGVAQIAGLTLFVYGQTTPKTAPLATDARRAVTISVAPLITRSTGGATVFAAF
jgi:hypothetical protein